MNKLLIIPILLIFTSLNAQIFSASPANQQWLQYYHHTKLNRKYSNITDLGVRFDNSFSSVSQALIRTAINRNFLKKYNVAAGIAFFTFKIIKTETINFRNIESRPFVEFNFKSEKKKIERIHRIRLEERIYFSYPKQLNKNIRMRYKIVFNYPINSKYANFLKNKLTFNAGYEWLGQSLRGPNIHRMMSGFSYKFNKGNSLSISYMVIGNMLLPLKDPNLYIYKNIIWLSVTHKNF